MTGLNGGGMKKFDLTPNPMDDMIPQNKNNRSYADMDNDREIKGKLIYEQDSIHYHRFKIDTHTNGAIVGSVYVQKDRDLPDKIILEREQE